MFELSRVRLHSIGPRGARFSDVVLDFSGVGQPVAGPRQDGLFLSDAARPRRPSPASVLFLENGGGKSVLMKLIFSVVLPGRRQVVGTSNGRVLDNFVLPRDCGHVVCEWQHAVTGERVVTGKVSEWRGRPSSAAEPPRLAEAWYSFRPREGFDMADLPLVHDGHLVTLAGFRDRLAAAHTADARMNAVWETSQSAWSDHLDSIGLDPELFRYQRAMNAGEGEAADTFAFSSDDQFVDFLLRAVTAPEDPAGLTEVIDSYAAKLAERAALTAEREFVAGALERLTPLVESASRRAAAEATLAVVQRDLASFTSAVLARISHERDGSAGLAAERDAAAQAESDRETDRVRAADIVVAVRRRIAELRLAGAEAERDRLVEAQRIASATVEAWRATDDVLRLAAASAEAERLTSLVTDAESAAAPALAARDAAARALVAGLLVLAEASDAEAEAAEATAADHEARAEAAAAAERRSSDSAATARARQQAVLDRTDEERQLRERAVQQGLLPNPAADVHGLAATARAAAEQASAAVLDALAALSRLDEERRAASERTRSAERARDEAETACRLTERARLDAASAAAALTADGRIAALLDVDAADHAEPADVFAAATAGVHGRSDAGADPATDLDACAEVALAALGRSVAAAEQRVLDLSIAADEDHQVLAALGDGGFLPVRAEVAATLAVLEKAGVAAVAGWYYLAHVVDADERETVLAAHPELVDGVVLTNPDALPRAREVLVAARLLPRAVVAIGGVSSLLDLTHPVADGERIFIVQPNPALYDAAAAETERLAIRARQDERQRAAAVLSDRAHADRALAAALTAWRRTCPPGRIAGLAAAAAEAEASRAGAERDLRLALRSADEAEAAAEATLATVTELRAAEQAAHARASALDRLASTLGDRGDTRQYALALAEEAAEAAAQAERHSAAAHVERRAAHEALRQADSARRNAEASRSETAGVVGAGAVRSEATTSQRETDQPDVGQAAPTPRPGPSVPVAVLRAAYEAASRTYEQVDVGADLRGDVARARRAEAEARAAADGLTGDVRALAQSLLAGTSGGDAAARAIAETQARRQLATVGEALDTARERVGGLREELRHVTDEARRRGVRQARGEWAAADLDTADELLRRARSEAVRADADATAARARTERTADRVRRQQVDLDAFEGVAEALADTAADVGRSTSGSETVQAQAAEAAFGGDVDAAREISRRLRSTWRDATTHLAAAASETRGAVDAVVSWAGQDQFEPVRAPARRQMVRAGRDAVAANAAVWEQALAPRLRSLDDDLAHIGRNRAAIVARLEGMVRAALGTLRAAARLSRLPDQLGDWSGQEFLRVAFAEPEPAALTEALGEVVDSVATAVVATVSGDGGPGPAGTGTRRGSPGRRDGMTLLLRGVRAALPRGVKVEILKPDAVLRTERVRVSQMGDVFSGGQQLTAAIILYCTMAALRANDRGQLRTPHAGVLFLDNPIGRASAAYLLDLQLAVAERLGVQLVYTTGLFDTSALASFPLVIRLRNDADLRAGLKYLRVEEHLRPALTPPDPGPDAGASAGVVSATRLFSRHVATPAPRPPHPADDTA